MFRSTSLALVLLSLSLGSGCGRFGATTPSSPATVEQHVYADLYTVQTALEGVKAQSAQYPDVAAKIRTQINQAIAAYNTAERAFMDYEAAKGKNLASATDLVQLQQMVLDLKSQIAALGKAFSNSNNPIPVKAVN
jgi:transcription initiation factor IIF auxiliary subunit